ncbi:MAG: hypothetical protein ACKO7A_18425, partial [Microcystis sp.]
YTESFRIIWSGVQLKKGFQTNVGIVETVIAGIIVAAILSITKFVVKSNGISQLPSQIVSNSLLVDNQDELYRKLIKHREIL